MEKLDPAVLQFAQVLGIEVEEAQQHFRQLLRRFVRTVEVPSRRTEFNLAFEALFQDFVAATAFPKNRVRGEFGRHLGTLLGQDIQALRVKQWTITTQPRNKEARQAVLAAAKTIVARARAGELPEQAKMVPAETVKAEIASWVAKGLNREQMALATEQSAYTIGTWARGEVDLPVVKFEAAKARIATWYDLLLANGQMTFIGADQFKPYYQRVIDLGFTDEDILSVVGIPLYRLRCLAGKATPKHPAALPEYAFHRFLHAFLPEEHVS